MPLSIRLGSILLLLLLLLLLNLLLLRLLFVGQPQLRVRTRTRSCWNWLTVVVHSGRGMNHAGSGYRLEQFLDLRCTLDEFMTPEVVVSIFDQFNESNQQTCQINKEQKIQDLCLHLLIFDISLFHTDKMLKGEFQNYNTN